ncbi:hypothetical protein J4219_03505 [Candidatus Woesearchaeota archaeon]|nr:hypothetical protein [Candidatus Woesearchaeota archaeon]
MGPKAISTIWDNPEILISLFRTLFPEMERTRGQLQMDPNWKRAYKDCAKYDQENLWPAIERLHWK